jgi:hypothetical protein
MGGDAFKSTKESLRRTAVELAMRRAMKETAVSNRIIKGFKRSQAIMSNRCRALYLRFLLSRYKSAEAQAKETNEAIGTPKDSTAALELEGAAVHPFLLPTRFPAASCTAHKSQEIPGVKYPVGNTR